MQRSNSLPYESLWNPKTICCTAQEGRLRLTATMSSAIGESSLYYLIGPPVPRPPLPLSFLPNLPSPFHQGDRGGRLTLQKRWTSFLKARLVCSLPKYDFHFNMLRSVFVMPGHVPQETLFYGIFGLEWWVSRGTGVANERGGDERCRSIRKDSWGRQEGVRWEKQRARGNMMRCWIKQFWARIMSDWWRG